MQEAPKFRKLPFINLHRFFQNLSPYLQNKRAKINVEFTIFGYTILMTSKEVKEWKTIP